MVRAAPVQNHGCRDTMAPPAVTAGQRPYDPFRAPDFARGNDMKYHHTLILSSLSFESRTQRNNMYAAQTPVSGVAPDRLLADSSEDADGNVAQPQRRGQSRLVPALLSAVLTAQRRPTRDVGPRARLVPVLHLHGPTNKVLLKL